MTLKHITAAPATAPPAGDTIGGNQWNEDHLIDANGAKMTTTGTVPSTPASGNLQFFARNLAGSGLPAYVDQSGLTSAVQPFLGRNKIGMWIPSGNTTTVTTFGMALGTLNGTGTTRNVATTNLLTSARRLGAVSSTTAGSFTGWRAASFQFFRSSTAGMGGFRAVFRWGCSDAATVSGAASFVGMAAASVGAVNPSSATNIIGVGTDSGDTTLQLIYNDGASTATKVNLGANFPDHTLSADLYELAIFSASNSTTVGIEVTRLNTGDVYTNTLSTDIPAVNTLLGPQVMRNNGSTALAVGVDMVGVYIETDN